MARTYYETTGAMVPEDLSFLAAWLADDFEVAERLGLDTAEVRGQIVRVLTPVARSYLIRECLPATDEAVAEAITRQYHCREGVIGPDDILDLFTTAWWKGGAVRLMETPLIPGQEYPRVFLRGWDKYVHPLHGPYEEAHAWLDNGGVTFNFSSCVGGIEHIRSGYIVWEMGVPSLFPTAEEAFDHIVNAARVAHVRRAMGV